MLCYELRFFYLLIMWSWISSWLHKNMPSTLLMLLHLQFCYTRYIWEYFRNVVLFKNSKTQIDILFIYLKYLETGYPVGICVLSINMKILDLIKVQFWMSDPFTFFLWLSVIVDLWTGHCFPSVLYICYLHICAFIYQETIWKLHILFVETFMWYIFLYSCIDLFTS